MLPDQSTRIAASFESARSVSELPSRGPSSLASNGQPAQIVPPAMTRWQIARPYLERFVLAFAVLFFARTVHVSLIGAYLCIAIAFTMQYISEAHLRARFGFLFFDIFCALLAGVAVFQLNTCKCSIPTDSPTAFPTTVSPTAFNATR